VPKAWRDAEHEVGGQTSLQVGDCWVVESGSDRQHTLSRHIPQEVIFCQARPDRQKGPSRQEFQKAPVLRNV
jgi:hypothetical protein